MIAVTREWVEAQAWIGDQRAAVLEVLAERDRAESALAKLQAFKRYVHDRLDKANVPSDPEPEANAEHGCRIEGRLNYVLEADCDELVSRELTQRALDVLVDEGLVLRDAVGRASVLLREALGQ